MASLGNILCSSKQENICHSFYIVPILSITLFLISLFILYSDHANMAFPWCSDLECNANPLSLPSGDLSGCEVKCQNLQFIDWPLEAGSKREQIPIQPHVKMPKFTAEINMFTAWFKENCFGFRFFCITSCMAALIYRWSRH